MTHMPAPRFTLPARISLTLLILTLALAIWSFRRPHLVFGQTNPAPARYREVGLCNGHFAVSTIQTFPPPNLGPGHPYGGNTSFRSILGVTWRDQRTTLMHPRTRSTLATVNQVTSVSIHLALPLLLFAILPANWLLLYWRARRTPLQGHCPTCGYDLRASKHRCPECGTPVVGARQVRN